VYCIATHIAKDRACFLKKKKKLFLGGCGFHVALIAFLQFKVRSKLLNDAIDLHVEDVVYHDGGNDAAQVDLGDVGHRACALAS